MNTRSEKEYINDYVAKGYEKNYRIEQGKLRELESKNTFGPSEVHIHAEHRFEGTTNPSDMSILYAVETRDGGKGTVLANYSPAADTEMAAFFNAVPKENMDRKDKIT
ncbi:hypothetical protein [Maribacter sp. 2307ULW6-5]|uniref:hypothetical protein n=1 Tax=Maribacter sp. 2307ULW6-5 TaxID=3386275 RepID=UPI0039BC74C3